MKLLSTLLLLFFTTVTMAQTNDPFWEFAVVKDKDGYCNVRRSGEVTGNVTDKLYNGDLVLVAEKQGNWMLVGYRKNNEERFGFIYYDRLQLVSSYKNIPATAKNEHTVTFGNSAATLTVATEAFNKSKYRITSSPDSQWVKRINGKKFWGTDGFMPTRAYTSIVLTINKKKISLPKAAFDDLFQPSLTHIFLHYDEAGDIYYLHAMNSDGVASYTVVWKIEKGVYKRRSISLIA